VHLQDIIHWAMGVTAPRSVHAAGGKFTLDDIRDTPDTLLVTYEFDSPHGPFIQFYEMRKGNNRGIGGDPGHGMQFHGTDATLYLDRGGFHVIPERQRTAAIKSGRSDQNWPHVQDFLRCVKSRARCISDVETGHTSTAVCHLGNISYKLGRKIFWDAPSETIVDQKGLPTPRPMPCSGESTAKATNCRRSSRLDAQGMIANESRNHETLQRNESRRDGGHPGTCQPALRARPVNRPGEAAGEAKP